ncbi:hypothetical protein RJ640_004394 [Escallonia rubra]|uniref:Glutamate receptor n=1 Tax=Escallonia rubra TaxID=112253 RepID=A0AA88QEY1_9ASTE|nr:hypothetical protein RJ640_004394 [Escallonia rubra]
MSQPQAAVLDKSSPQIATASRYAEISHVKGASIGAILDTTSRVGKEAKVAMEIAIDDFTRDTNQILVLHIRNSQSKPMLAGHAARELIDTLKVKAILGPHTWEEAFSIADVGSQAHIPTLSLADSIPKWALQHWPFFVQASPSKYAQMKAVAAIIQSWGQRRVTFVYEDVDSTSIRVTSHLSDALNKVGAEISHLIALPPLTSSYSKELERHKQEQGTTFVVHTSLASAVRLFHTAKRMGMVGKDNLWVVTSAVTDLLHSLNTTTLSSMQGIIGVRSYFPESKPQFQDFSKRFRQKFCMEYPEEENYEPGIFAVQAYDATSMVALAVNGSNMTSGGGQNLLQHISRVNFNGLTGKVQFRERKFSTARQFQIVNVFGKIYVGLSPSGLGFPGTDDESTTYCSIQYLGQVFCSREQFRPTQTRQPLPTTLKVGVPHRSNFKQFVNTDNKDHYTGFSIEVFREIMKGFPDLRYKFIPFSEGSYDDMVEQVYKKAFSKGFPKVDDINKVLLNVSESGKLRELEKEYIVSEKCVDAELSTIENASLGLQNLWVLIVLTGARDLIDTHRVEAILGPHTWEETLSIAEVGSHAQIPTFSLSDSSPLWAVERWPFLVQASPNNYAQMNAVAAIIRSWGQRHVTMIYEDTDSTSSRVISYLSDALQNVGIKMINLVALPPLPSSSFFETLRRLEVEQRTTYVVYTSLDMAIPLFHTAKKMNLMGNNEFWIATSPITDLLHSLNATVISSMQGIVGVRSYFPESGPQFQVFRRSFRKKFNMENPEEENYEPGIFAVQAYDATWVLAAALDGTDTNGKQLIEKVLQVDYKGLSGKFNFTERKLAAARLFEIVNVVRQTCSGFWSDGLGFSENIGDDNANYVSSIQKLEQDFCSMEQWNTRRRQTLSTSTNIPLRVGVPSNSCFKQFVNTDNKDYYTGFSIEVFREIMRGLPNLKYEFILSDEPNYTALVEQIHKKKFDAVAADTMILASRLKYADFTQPYTESGLEMIVSLQPKVPAGWVFMKPFTGSMWTLIAAITIYNGFVIWLVERNYCTELKGSSFDQIGILLCLAFTTLFTLYGEKLHSNLSRMAMVVWLFVALIITQSYTASFASMLTAQRLEPRISDIETLKKTNASVGYSKGSYIECYLTNVLGFPHNKLAAFETTQEFAKALRSGEIGAVFLSVPKAKLFLSQYCRSFTKAGETYQAGGFGFAFSKGFPHLHDINEALLNVSETGKLRDLEKKYIMSEKCVESELSTNENGSLSLQSFWILFVLTGGTSTVALTIYVVVGFKKRCTRMLDKHKSVCTSVMAVVTNMWHQRRMFSRSVHDAEFPPDA